MGIEELYSGYLLKLSYPGVRSRNIPSDIISINLDFNGEIHRVAQQVYKYGEWNNPVERRQDESFSDEALEEQFFQTLTTNIQKIIETVKPRHGSVDAIAICIDGVAAPAKINQQKGRRYKSAYDAERVSKDISPVRFNSAAITPGTEFMIRLDARLKGWINVNRAILPRLTIYSSHLVPGEGEHKIFRYFRDGTIPQSEGHHAIYGKDGDLIMLSLLSPYDNIVLIREDFKDIINIGALKDGIVADMNGKFLSPALDLEMDPNAAIRDFVVMAYFIGNDFLPRIIAFDDVKVALDLCITVYRHTYQHFNNQLTLSNEDGTFNHLFLAKFLATLASQEADMLRNKASYEFRFPSPILNEAVVKIPLPPDPERKHYEPRYEVKSIDYEKFRTSWYKNALGPRMDPNDLIEEIPPIDLDDIHFMCKWYLYGLEWIYNYYIGKINYKLYTKEYHGIPLPGVALDYVYPFKHAPLLVDMANQAIITSNDKTSFLDLPIEPIYISAMHQLVSVIPPSFANLIPAGQRRLILPGGHLADLCPLTFVLEYQAKNKEYQSVAILPTFDLHRVIDMVDTTLKKGLRIAGTDQLTSIIPGKYRLEPEYISELKEHIPIPYVGRANPQNRGVPSDRGSPRGRGGGYRGRGGGDRGRGGGDRGGRGRGGGGDRGRGDSDRGRGGGYRGGRGGNLPPPRATPTMFSGAPLM